jgi:anaerobic selenocysteine-containing dehydrogenase
VRAFLTVAGNPVSSTPNGRRLDRALASLEFMAAIDIYVNETTRHADVILPPASMLCHDNYDVVFNALAVRNVARVNPPVFDKPEGSLYDWEIFNGIGTRVREGCGRRIQGDAVARWCCSARPRRRSRTSRTARTLGRSSPRSMERLETPDAKIQCAPAAFVADLARVRSELVESTHPGIKLVGRRHLRSNNSWMHNSHRLVKGRGATRCGSIPPTRPRSACARARRSRCARSREPCADGPRHRSRRPGVVCLPHGFSQGREGVRLAEASKIPA